MRSTASSGLWSGCSLSTCATERFVHRRVHRSQQACSLRHEWRAASWRPPYVKHGLGRKEAPHGEVVLVGAEQRARHALRRVLGLLQPADAHKDQRVALQNVALRGARRSVSDEGHTRRRWAHQLDAQRLERVGGAQRQAHLLDFRAHIVAQRHAQFPLVLRAGHAAPAAASEQSERPPPAYHTTSGAAERAGARAWPLRPIRSCGYRQESTQSASRCSAVRAGRRSACTARRRS
jgi:hypothetical protein